MAKNLLVVSDTFSELDSATSRYEELRSLFDPRLQNLDVQPEGMD